MNLLSYFDDYLCILNSLEIGKFIFTGRKGVGKSAIAKYIKDLSDDNEQSHAKILKIGDYELEKHIQEVALQESKQKLIFEWLILVNLVKLIVENECGKYTKEFTKLKRFLDINSGVIDVDKHQFITGEKNKGGEVNFAPLKHVFGGVFKNYFKTSVNKAPFYKVIPPLKQIVKIVLDFPVNKETEFWLLFDDLDINFSVKNKLSADKVMELIRISRDYNNELLQNNKAKILIFLRDDMRDFLKPKYADSAKIFNSYEININWYDHSVLNENEIPLKRLINKRVELNFKKNEIEFIGDPWENLFTESYINGKSIFKYILDFTFYRPRDIITLLNVLSLEDYQFPIDHFTLKRIIKKYIHINIDELKSELSLFFTGNDINILFDKLFPYICENQNILEKELNDKIEDLGFSINTHEVIELLSKYSLIILRDNNGNLYFQYRDDTELDNIDRSHLHYTLPKCIYHKYKFIN
ncbi:hypothetical protein CW751_08125 [Brumimicrobium salinarum]|uniref:ATPase domain-containing protein n=1 Tax=Brumimicrobium salinarum TaxID=2058658 RepID=A0A2I0R2B8_9FLAO|nr:hypothetical protein [Brumimicrobium salinarum]PKR80728.1 hypothetical protein CW751_08125 [Brumimicrobium salinarum]